MILSMASKLASFANLTQTMQPDPPLMKADPVNIDLNSNHDNDVIAMDIESKESILIKSILKPESLSLEPTDKRTRTKSNTPRKVQFHIVEGEYGGRGQTEFSKTPKRKSHTKKQLPIGIFDTDSNTDDTLSDIDENSAKKTIINNYLLSHM
eukprot:UN02448